MPKIAYIFPGQGAQYVGMSRELIEADSENKIYLDKFQERTGYDLADIILNGPEEKLKDTRFTQPAILFHSIAALKMWQKEIDIVPDFVAGHSLGEFSALVANGVLELSDAMYLVHKRGEFMIKASEGKPYGMIAIIGLSPDTVAEICEKASPAGIVIVANFNTPVQTVISGSQSGIEAAMKLAEEAGAKRIIPLVVGGAFHSPLVAKASVWLEEEMDKIKFSSIDIPVVANVDAKSWTDISQIKENLSKQVSSSVRWVESIKYMSDRGVDTFIEFGPQKVLGGMLRKIDRQLKTYNVEKPEDIPNVITLLEKGD